MGRSYYFALSFLILFLYSAITFQLKETNEKLNRIEKYTQHTDSMFSMPEDHD